jgi:hypothetical protein
MSISIGYNRTVKLAWLETVVGLLLVGKNDKEIYESLLELLKNQLSTGSDAIRGSREKTITLLMKTWVRIPKELVRLRDEALELYPIQNSDFRIVLHWGMTFATYPFCKAIAELVGRSLRLQETAVAPQIQRRAREMLGERETVARSTRYVVRAFHDWGVLEETGKPGVYRNHRPLTIKGPRLAAWLFEAFLQAGNNEPVSARSVLGSPAFFPFDFSSLNFRQVISDKRFDVSRQGLDEDMVRVNS